VNDPVTVTLKWRPEKAFFFRKQTATRICGVGREGGCHNVPALFACLVVFACPTYIANKSNM
jgi:hypothetical protein